MFQLYFLACRFFFSRKCIFCTSCYYYYLCTFSSPSCGIFWRLQRAFFFSLSFSLLSWYFPSMSYTVKNFPGSLNISSAKQKCQTLCRKSTRNCATGVSHFSQNTLFFGLSFNCKFNGRQLFLEMRTFPKIQGKPEGPRSAFCSFVIILPSKSWPIHNFKRKRKLRQERLIKILTGSDSDNVRTRSASSTVQSLDLSSQFFKLIWHGPWLALHSGNRDAGCIMSVMMGGHIPPSGSQASYCLAIAMPALAIIYPDCYLVPIATLPHPLHSSQISCAGVPYKGAWCNKHQECSSISTNKRKTLL